VVINACVRAAGRPLFAEYTPVTDFWEGVCKQLEKDGVCSRGPNCNFMHLKKIGKTLEKELCTFDVVGCRCSNRFLMLDPEGRG
jgi:hypothetical protein